MLQKSGEKTTAWQFFVTFLGWLSDPFEWLSDLQLGDEKDWKGHKESPGGDGAKTSVNNGINYQPQQVIPGFRTNHQEWVRLLDFC